MFAGVALTGYKAKKHTDAQKELAELQAPHEEVVKQEARPIFKGSIVTDGELRLLNPETRQFERFVINWLRVLQMVLTSCSI
jgi:hypothetical protein